MDLVRHLRYFLAVAEELHFGRAAARLRLAQPALSQRIRRLEQEYGVPLFDRSGGRVRLTVSGEALVEEAREIVARVDAAAARVRAAGRNPAGPLRAGIPPDVPGRVLATLIAGFAEAVPGIPLDLRAATSTEQLRMLEHGELDVGVLHHPIEAGGLAFGPAVSLTEGVALSRRSPLAERVELTLAELAGNGLVQFPREAAPGRYDTTLETCRRHGFRPTELRHAASTELMLGLVAAGGAVAFTTAAVAQKEARVVWRRLTGDPLTCRLSTAWPRRAPHRAVPRFTELVGNTLIADEPATGTPEPSRAPRPWAVVFPQRLPRA